jgi:glycosyltransferase involved in cell wall biosynthesis
MLISIIVPTYRRPHDLANCLQALKKQLHQPDEVLVIVRDTDDATSKMLSNFLIDNLPLKIITVQESGVVKALNAGLSNAVGDIVAITDDDAAPHADWLAKIIKHFATDQQLGGVGGRDWMYINSQLQTAAMHPGASPTVGHLQWFGRLIGNHHIGEGEARYVDVLKGVNMSYRRSAIRDLYFNEQLKGAGAQVDNEVDFCLKVKQRGWKLLYDPQVAVDHFLGQRFDKDQRRLFNDRALSDSAYNETIILLQNLPPLRRTIFLFWAVLIGTRQRFGIFQLLRFYPQEQQLAVQKWQMSMQGRWEGLQDWLRQSPASHL